MPHRRRKGTPAQQAVRARIAKEAERLAVARRAAAGAAGFASSLEGPPSLADYRFEDIGEGWGHWGTPPLRHAPDIP